MNTKTLKLIALLIAFSMSLGGCATFGKKRSKKQTNGSGLVKAGTKQQGNESTDTGRLKPPTLKAKLRFLRAQAKPNSFFDEKERKFVSALKPSPKRGTFAEAALTVGLLKTVLSPLHEKSTSFQETDLIEEDKTESQPGVEAKGLSIEAVCKERGLDLPGALTENRNLHNYPIAKMAVLSLSAGKNSQAFIQKVKQAVASQAILWNKLGPDVGLNSAAIAELPPQPVETPLPEIEDEEISRVPPSPADLRDADAILVEAQALSDNGKHQEAIALAGHVSPGNPMYSASREKIKGFSNRAVQELRRKAAQAFQSSVPVSDKKVRAEYLQQARTYLEEALKKFPAATHLQRVRENLRVISQDLERITQDLDEEA